MQNLFFLFYSVCLGRGLGRGLGHGAYLSRAGHLGRNLSLGRGVFARAGLAFLVLAVMWSGGFSDVFAQGRAAPIIIRDTEIEATLKEWTAPLFEAAQIDPNGVDIILVQSPQVNAFVAGGANIFIYTGLIEKTKNPEELIGVLAHELGHIEGGHLISGRAAFERASYESIIGVVLGIGAAVLSGQGEAAGAIITGTQGVAGRRILAHTRVNESAADQAALRYMDASGINPEGLVDFFRTLETQELLPSSQQAEYVRTHPLTRNRIDAILNGAKKSEAFGKDTPARWIEGHARMKAKLLGFINPVAVPWTYDDRDVSVAADYARAIAAYRTNEVERSLTLLDKLLAREPENPYFLELKGQILVDYSRIDEALPIYRHSVRLLGTNAGLVQQALGHALLESGDDVKLNEAITVLRASQRQDSRSRRTYRLLATAYGRQGNDITAKLYLAEEAVLQRRFSYAREQAEHVAAHAPKGSRDALQARDILTYLDTTSVQERVE